MKQVEQIWGPSGIPERDPKWQLSLRNSQIGPHGLVGAHKHHETLRAARIYLCNRWIEMLGKRKPVSLADGLPKGATDSLGNKENVLQFMAFLMVFGCFWSSLRVFRCPGPCKPEVPHTDCAWSSRNSRARCRLCHGEGRNWMQPC